MRAGRTIRRCLAGLFLAAVVAAGVLYLLASRVPSDYRPARLAREDRDAAMRRFRRRLMDFSNDGQGNRPFSWSLSEEEINRYLDAMDEIAAERGAKPGTMERALRKAGLSDPSVALADGALTLMARSTKYEKIVSVQLEFERSPDGKLRMGIASVRVGQLPIPASLVRGRIEKLRDALSRATSAPGAEESPELGGLSSQEVGEIAARVLAAMDGRPIDAEVTWRISARKRVRIDRIEIDNGQLTVHVVPITGPRGGQ